MSTVSSKRRKLHKPYYSTICRSFHASWSPCQTWQTCLGTFNLLGKAQPDIPELNWCVLETQAAPSLRDGDQKWHGNCSCKLGENPSRCLADFPNSSFSSAAVSTFFQKDYFGWRTTYVYYLARLPSSLSPLGDPNVSIFGMTNL